MAIRKLLVRFGVVAIIGVVGGNLTVGANEPAVVAPANWLCC
jgi:hypothetical protein